jgi:hypothetical protein
MAFKPSRRTTAALSAAALVAAVGAGAAHSASDPIKGGSFRGTTSQLDSSGRPEPVSFRLKRGGRAATNFVAAWDAHCDNGKTFSSDTKLRHIALSKQRSFSTAGAYSAVFEDGSGYSAQIRGSVRGRLRRDGSATGSLMLSVTVSAQDGTRVTACSTPRITFRAKSGR